MTTKHDEQERQAAKAAAERNAGAKKAAAEFRRQSNAKAKAQDEMFGKRRPRGRGAY